VLPVIGSTVRSCPGNVTGKPEGGLSQPMMVAREGLPDAMSNTQARRPENFITDTSLSYLTITDILVLF
jgi:hypothetical protein